MYLDSQQDAFRVEIPKAFIPKHISDKYQPYHERLPNIVQSIPELINLTIQSITIPPKSYDAVDQVHAKNDRDPDSRGRTRSFRSSMHRQNLRDKTFTITFKMLNGYFNYWILDEIYEYYYKAKQTYTFDIPVRILDDNGIILYTAKFTNVLFTGMSEFELSYANNIREFSTFECTFTYNTFESSLDID